jgi:tetratricopeptide (TPR) repeat protein
MPQRPRSHELEDESRRHFQMALPSRWVFRPADPDYGIDGQVELFGQDGEAVGLVFLVQLKATDNPELKDALAISLKRDTFRYYRRLDLPVMLAEFHAPTKTIFWAWLHEFDPEYPSRGQDTLTIRLPVQAAWNSKTAERIEEDLRTFRALKSPHVALPIEFRLVLQEVTVHNAPAALVESAILDAAMADSTQIRLLKGDLPGAHPKVLIGNEKTEVTLAGLKSVTLHTRGKYPEKLAIGVFPHDVLTLVAFVLHQAGHSNIAAQVAAKHLDKSSVLGIPEIVLSLLGALARAGRTTDALHLAERLLDSPDRAFLAQLMVVPALLNLSSLSASEVEYVRHVMRSIIERAEREGNNPQAATAHYNLGNHLRSQGGPDQRAAFNQYRLAAKLDPEYLRRHYFWKELGGVLFGLGHYGFSARAYQKAMDLGATGNSLALTADALMFGGKYQQAQELFTKYFEQEKNADSEWRLKAFALKRMSDFLGVKEQKRQTCAANGLADLGKEIDSETVIPRCREALEADALCPLAWFNLAVRAYEVGRKADALLGFTLAGLIGRVDTEAWANSLLVAFGTGEYEAFRWIAQTAYSINRTAFLEALQTLLQRQDERFPVDKFLDAIREIIGLPELRDRSFELRVLGEDARFRSFDLMGQPSNLEGVRGDLKKG